MSLLVLGSSMSSANSLQAQLESLGLDSEMIPSSADALRLSHAGAVSAVLCSSLSDIQALTDLPADVALIFVRDEQTLTLECLQAALFGGAHDCWVVPLSNQDLKARLGSLLTRVRRGRSASAEVPEGRAAEFVQDRLLGQQSQMGMLPPNPTVVGPYTFRYRVEPALMLSGDFVDCFALSEQHFAFFLADVAGHGIPAALITVLLKSSVRRLCQAGYPDEVAHPGVILAKVNQELIDFKAAQHAAVFLAILDTENQRLSYTSAAQFPPAILCSEGRAGLLEHKGKPLGLFDHARYESSTVAFPADAKLVVFTDGILDLVEGKDLLSKERYLVDLVQRAPAMESLWQAFDIADAARDDVSCLMLTHVGSQ